MSNHKFPNETIVRSAGKGQAFTQICNEFLRHPDIPFDEKGFLAFLLTFPGNWRVTFAHILATNKTVGLKGLRSLIRRLEKREYVIVVPQKRNERGVFGPPIIIASDDTEEAKKAHKRLTEATAKELAEMIEPDRFQPPTPKGYPVEHEPPTPSRQAARRQAVTAPLLISKEKNIEKKKYESSLSTRAIPNSADPVERELVEWFEKLKGAAREAGFHWNHTSRQTALTSLASISQEKRQLAVDAVPHYQRACIKHKRDCRVGLHTYLVDRTFDDFVGDIEAAKAAEDERQKALQERAEMLKRLDEKQAVEMEELRVERLVAQQLTIARLDYTARLTLCIHHFRRLVPGWDRDSYGPAPGESGCLVPAEQIEAALDYMRQNHPAELEEFHERTRKAA